MREKKDDGGGSDERMRVMNEQEVRRETRNERKGIT